MEPEEGKARALAEALDGWGVVPRDGASLRECLLAASEKTERKVAMLSAQLVAAGLARPWPGFHTLRHTAASRWFRAGLSCEVVSRLLGHSNPAFTFRTYVHMIRSDLPDMDALGRGWGVALD